jgi:hypothetical protein
MAIFTSRVYGEVESRFVKTEKVYLVALICFVTFLYNISCPLNY